MFWNMNQRWSASGRQWSAPSLPPAARNIERTGDSERGEILQVLAVDAPSSKDVHHVVDQGRGVSLARYGDVANARELDPDARVGVVAPRVVVVILAVRSSEACEGEEESACARSQHAAPAYT
jgi:hypothetical protein